MIVVAALAIAAHTAAAALVPVSPVRGATIARVPDVQKKVMDLATLEERIADLFGRDFSDELIAIRDVSGEWGTGNGEPASAEATADKRGTGF